eukprot:jgi/Bigna1/76470/fgenesh1_pg.41_\
MKVKTEAPSLPSLPECPCANGALFLFIGGVCLSAFLYSAGAVDLLLSMRTMGDVPLPRSVTVPSLLALFTLFTAATIGQYMQRRGSEGAGGVVKYSQVSKGGGRHTYEDYPGEQAARFSDVLDSPTARADEKRREGEEGGGSFDDDADHLDDDLALSPKEGGEWEQEESTRLQTGSEASYNIVNMYVGVGLWSLPYSLVVGGWEALLVLLVLLVLCYMSAENLVRLYDQFKTRERSFRALLCESSYSAKLGLISKSLERPSVPLAPLDEWSNMAYINAFGTAARSDVVTIKGFARAVGLQMVALGSGTPAVPSIYQQIQSRSEFPLVMVISFVVIAVFCFAMTVGGFFTYGQKSEILIIDNLMQNDAWGSLISLMVAAASFATTPPFIAMTTEIPLAALNLQVGRAGRRAMRYLVYFITIAGCVLLMESLDLILELTGLLCMSMTAIVLPIAMSLKQKLQVASADNGVSFQANLADQN